jgi:hypothetical protein
MHPLKVIFEISEKRLGVSGGQNDKVVGIIDGGIRRNVGEPRTHC